MIVKLGRTCGDVAGHSGKQKQEGKVLLYNATIRRTFCEGGLMSLDTSEMLHLLHEGDAKLCID